MGSELLIEIGAEEIPAGFVGKALAFVERELASRLSANRLEHGEIGTAATPRRLAVWAYDVAERQPDLEEEKTGPPKRIAFDGDGNPTKAALGFAKGQGVDFADVYEVETSKGVYLAARVRQEGRPATDVLPAVVEEVISRVPFRKSMRWEPSGVTFARPVRWLLVLFAGEVLDVTFGDVRASNTTIGHRIMDPDPVEVHDVASWRAALEERHVVLDVDARKKLIESRLVELADEVGGNLVKDDSLVAEVANLCEFPWGAVGRFDKKYLELPREVLLTSMRSHQRYFAFEDDDGELLAAFGVFSNTVVRDKQIVVEGNERVLKARLSDGEFFYREDQKRTLADRVSALDRVTFLGELDRAGLRGDLGGRAERISALAGWLSTLVATDADLEAHARRAGSLAKADLTTLMVGEFPDLQGVMGGYYAEQDGEPGAVATAIREHYRPRGASDAPPQTVAGAVVALADKLDLIASCFVVSLVPSGNKDPYGLRRAALGILRILAAHDFDLDLDDLVKRAVDEVSPKAGSEVAREVLDFFKGRLKSELAEDYRTDIVDAVLSADATRPLDVRRRTEALSRLAEEADLAPVGEAFKRINNILQKNRDAVADDAAFEAARAVEDEERALGSLAAEIRDTMRSQLSGGDYYAALGNLLRLQEPLDAFFTKVMVMHEDAALRTNRLALLVGLWQTFESVADVSRIHITRS